MKNLGVRLGGRVSGFLLPVPASQARRDPCGCSRSRCSVDAGRGCRCFGYQPRAGPPAKRSISPLAKAWLMLRCRPPMVEVPRGEQQCLEGVTHTKESRMAIVISKALASSPSYGEWGYGGGKCPTSPTCGPARVNSVQFSSDVLFSCFSMRYCLIWEILVVTQASWIKRRC